MLITDVMDSQVKKDKMMGFRTTIKRQMKLALKRIVDRIIDEDSSGVGVPSQQARPQQPPKKMQEPEREEAEKVQVAQEEQAPSSSTSVPAEDVQQVDQKDNEDISNVEENETTIEEHPAEDSLIETLEEAEEESDSSSSEEASHAEEIKQEEVNLEGSDKEEELEQSPVEEAHENVVEEEEDSHSAESKEHESSAQKEEASPMKDNVKEPVLSEEEKKQQAADKHLAKTKKGLVKKVSDLGGATTLPELHDYSEKRFFVGHKRFSDLMEEMISEDLLCFSYEDSSIVLGTKAKDFLS